MHVHKLLSNLRFLSVGRTELRVYPAPKMHLVKSLILPFPEPDGVSKPLWSFCTKTSKVTRHTTTKFSQNPAIAQTYVGSYAVLSQPSLLYRLFESDDEFILEQISIPSFESKYSYGCGSIIAWKIREYGSQKAAFTILTFAPPIIVPRLDTVNENTVFSQGTFELDRRDCEEENEFRLGQMVLDEISGQICFGMKRVGQEGARIVIASLSA